ncbi:MAG: MBL fold metallo-hydrolase [Thermodesulfobacteriota bacterium]|nr:MBL fold metallo-hydrolase [Thermodesulfobacteriota bacterium]
MLITWVKGLAFTTPMEKLYTISVDETIQLDGMTITGIKATHRPVTIKIGPLFKTLKPGPDERVGWGAIGFSIQFDRKSVVNLGDTLLHEIEWKGMKNPDVLIIPIGGKTVHNKTDEKEAIQSVIKMHLKLVIPCHYNNPALFSKRYNSADDKMFKKEVEKMGIECVFRKGGSIDI